MQTWTSTLVVCLPGPQSDGSLMVDSPPLVLNVGSSIGTPHAEDLGLKEGKFTERALAFFVLLVLDHKGLLDSPTERERVSQRRRFAEHLGMTPSAFRKFVERTFRQRSGRILRWDRQPNRWGPEPSWTGGPWRLVVRDARIEPRVTEAQSFLDRLRSIATARRDGPQGLLRAALSERDAGNWSEALVLLDSSVEMYQRRRWPRRDPLWFDILLSLGGTQMQLGQRGLWPRVPVNIRISVKEQGLRGPDIDLVLARAHYLAAMIYSQRADRLSAESVHRELQPCVELLDGHHEPAALRELWKARSYQELVRARLTGLAEPKTSSAILEASRVIDERREQKRMRYGQTLLHAGKPSLALDYIQGAIESRSLEVPAQVIAERLKIIAEWMLGTKTAKTLDALEQIERRVLSLGFAHQARIIREHKRRIRRGIRSLVL